MGGISLGSIGGEWGGFRHDIDSVGWASHWVEGRFIVKRSQIDRFGTGKLDTLNKDFREF